MKISTKGRYALRLMLDIARNGEEEAVRLADAARRQEISVKYLEQIAVLLVRAGYLKSVRGPQGGYRLTRSPEEYTAGDILRVTEGNLAPVECLEGEKNECPRAPACETLRLWKELWEAVHGVTERYTLRDLLGDEAKK